MSRDRAEKAQAMREKGGDGVHTRFLEPGESVLVGILVAGAAFILATWLFAHQLSGALAEVQLRHHARDIAGQVADILAEARWDGRATPDREVAVALGHLARFGRVQRLDVATLDGRVVWSSAEGTAAARIAVPADDHAAASVIGGDDASPVVRMVAALSDVKAKKHEGAVPGLVAVELEAGSAIAWYHRMGYLFAKAITIVIMVAMLVTGLLLLRRMHERRQAEEELARLRREKEQEHRRVEALQLQLVRLQEELARLNRRLAGTMRAGASREASDGTGSDEGAGTGAIGAARNGAG